MRLPGRGLVLLPEATPPPFDSVPVPAPATPAKLQQLGLWDEARAQALAAKCAGKPGVVTEEAKPTTQGAPLLYDLTELQRLGRVGGIGRFKVTIGNEGDSGMGH